MFVTDLIQVQGFIVFVYIVLPLKGTIFLCVVGL
jgi:hypothetical protein